MVMNYDEYLLYMKRKIKKGRNEKTYSSKLYGAYTVRPVLSGIRYIVELLYKRQLKPPYNRIQFKDKELISKSNFMNAKYYRRLDTLMCLGIINPVNRHYIPHEVSMTYAVNVDRLIQVWKDAVNQDEENHLLDRDKMTLEEHMQFPYTEINWEYVEHALRTGEWFPLEEISEEDEARNAETFNQIENFKEVREDSDPFFLKRNLTIKDKAYIAQKYQQEIVDTDPIYNECKALSEKLGLNFRVNIKFQKTKKNTYAIYDSYRQTNPLCNVRKIDREALLTIDGFDSEFDLHSAIFSIARLYNKKEFDCDWDIKKEINYEALGMSKETFKQTLFFIFFCKNNKEAYKAYKYHYRFHKRIGKELFNYVYDKCQDLIGGSKKYQYNIFKLESLLELKVMCALKEKGVEFKNVYDCFYFKSSQITVDEVKDLVNQIAAEIK